MADSNTPKAATQGQWEDLASRIKAIFTGKQDTLVSGTNIKTVNGNSILGSGDISVSGGPTVVQTSGASTTDVMSQNAVTSMVFADPSTKKMVQIGGTNIGSGDSVVVGGVSTAKDAVVVGNGAATAEGSVTLGETATTGRNAKGAVALGAGTGATVQGVVSIGASSSQYNSYTYNNSGYRLISGVHDPQSANDAANKNYVDTSVSSKLSITLSTTDIGEGATLAANTLYGVYE